SRRRHTRWPRDWSSDVCSSDLGMDASMTQASSATLRKSFRSQPARASLQALACAAALLVVVGVSGCNKLKARDLLNKGVNAFKKIGRASCRERVEMTVVDVECN